MDSGTQSAALSFAGPVLSKPACRSLWRAGWESVVQLEALFTLHPPSLNPSQDPRQARAQVSLPASICLPCRGASPEEWGCDGASGEGHALPSGPEPSGAIRVEHVDIDF